MVGVLFRGREIGNLGVRELVFFSFLSGRYKKHDIWFEYSDFSKKELKVLIGRLETNRRYKDSSDLWINELWNGVSNWFLCRCSLPFFLTPRLILFPTFLLKAFHESYYRA